MILVLEGETERTRRRDEGKLGEKKNRRSEAYIAIKHAAQPSNLADACTNRMLPRLFCCYKSTDIVPACLWPTTTIAVHQGHS